MMNTLEKIIKKTAAISLLTGSFLLTSFSYASFPTQPQTVSPPPEILKVLSYKKMIDHVTPNPTEAAKLAALIYTESRGEPNAQSPSGCTGLTQLSQQTALNKEVPDHTLFSP